MLDINTPKLDINTWQQLAAIKLGEIENRLKAISNIETRLKIIDDAKLAIEIQMLTAKIKDLEKRIIGLEKTTASKTSFFEKIKKINK